MPAGGFAGLSGVAGGYMDALNQLQQYRLMQARMQQLQSQQFADQALYGPGGAFAGGVAGDFGADMPPGIGSEGPAGPGRRFMGPVPGQPVGQATPSVPDVSYADTSDLKTGPTSYGQESPALGMSSPGPESLPPTIAGQPTGRVLSALQEGEGPRTTTVNPRSGALGLYQIMPENLEEWSRHALGYPVSREEFLYGPDAAMLQARVAADRFGQYAGQGGLQSAAGRWLGLGPSGDAYGTTAGPYSAAFMGRLAGAPNAVPGLQGGAGGGLAPVGQAPLGPPQQTAQAVPMGVPGVPSVGMGTMTVPQLVQMLRQRYPNMPPAAMRQAITEYMQVMKPYEREQMQAYLMLQRQEFAAEQQRLREEAAGERQQTGIAAKTEAAAAHEAAVGERQATGIKSRFDILAQRQKDKLEEDQLKFENQEKARQEKFGQEARMANLKDTLKKEFKKEPTIDDATADRLAEEYNRGRPEVVTALKDEADRSKVLGLATQKAEVAGMNPEQQLNNIKAQFGDRMAARMASVREANMDFALKEVESQRPYVQEAINAVMDDPVASQALTNWSTDWNGFMTATAERLGNTKIVALRNQLRALSNSYAKVVGGGNANPTVDARHTADQAIFGDTLGGLKYGPDQLVTVMDTIEKEGKGFLQGAQQLKDRWAGPGSAFGPKTSTDPEAVFSGQVDSAVEALKRTNGDPAPLNDALVRSGKLGEEERKKLITEALKRYKAQQP